MVLTSGGACTFVWTGAEFLVGRWHWNMNTHLNTMDFQDWGLGEPTNGANIRMFMYPYFAYKWFDGTSDYGGRCFLCEQDM
jgi:hypothetical protein